MGPSARREYMRHMQIRYERASSRKEKSRIISELCENLGYHRKHAIRLLNGPPVAISRPFKSTEKIYDDKVVSILREIWEAMRYPWSVRLKGAIGLWLPWIEKKHCISEKERKQLLSISASTIDRRLSRYKTELKRRVYGKTKAGHLLRQNMPIQACGWQANEPGWVEVDSVSHSGGSSQGRFGYTINLTDLFSGWTECRAVLGKGSYGVLMALEEIRQALPFKLKGIDSDNGEEFLNWHLVNYAKKHDIKLCTSRPYKKDDQAHIEQKNWPNVRKIIGWDRYDNDNAIDTMNELYRNEHRLLTNLYLPSVKLIKKIRVGSRLKKLYDESKTPLDRLLVSDMVNKSEVEKLCQIRSKLNPFELSKAMDRKLERIWKLASNIKANPIYREKVSSQKLKYTSQDLAPGYIASGDISSLYKDADIKRFRKIWWKESLLQIK